MKKLILIFGAFSIICVMITSVAQQRVQSLDSGSEQPTTVSATDTVSYTVKSENGKVVVYKGDELYLRTSTAVNTLPKIDQKTLLYGISVSSKEEVDALLQEYCS